MGFLLVFWLFLLGALTIGWQAGNRDDRKVILAIGGASALSAVGYLLFGEPVSLAVVAVVDIVLLVIVVRYALVSQRHWPIWFAGFHTAGTLFGASPLFFPVDDRTPLLLMGGFWSIPALLAMVIGLLRDQRRGIAGTDHR